jgi:hypothetical protein
MLAAHSGVSASPLQLPQWAPGPGPSALADSEARGLAACEAWCCGGNTALGGEPSVCCVQLCAARAACLRACCCRAHGGPGIVLRAQHAGAQACGIWGRGRLTEERAAWVWAKGGCGGAV